MELVTAARKRLLSLPGVTGYVGDKVWKHRREDDIVGTAGRAVVVKDGGGWSRPDPVQSSEYPLLTLECLADADRDGDGNPVGATALEKARALYRVIDPQLHGARHQWWGTSATNPGLLVISCARYAEPIALEDPRKPRGLDEEHGISVQYACHVVHGDVGPLGPPSPPLQAGVVGTSYLHLQTDPQSTWVISHMLGFRPGGVFVEDLDGNDLEGEIQHMTVNETRIVFNVPMSGRAYLS